MAGSRRKWPFKVKPSANLEPPASGAATVWLLRVHIIGGPPPRFFLAKDAECYRDIAILGKNTLTQLHRAIFKAFDRYEEHMFRFETGGRYPYDKNARRYEMPAMFEFDMGFGSMGVPSLNLRTGKFRLPPPPPGRVSAKIDSLGLQPGDVMGYEFDFGDGWQHQITVLGVTASDGTIKQAKVVAKYGESPPQYEEWDEEENEDEA